MRLRSNGTIIRNGANACLGLLVGLLLGLLDLQRRSMLNQRLGTAFTLAHIRTLACLLEVIAQPFLRQHDLLGSSNDEVAAQLLPTLTGLKGLFGLQLGQPALTASKHKRNPSQQDIVQRLGQDLGAHCVFHQQWHSNLQEIGAFIQAADMGHNGLPCIIGRSLLRDLIAFTASPVGTHSASIFQLKRVRIGGLQQLGNLLGQKGVLGVQVVANQREPRVAKQAGQKFPRDLHFLDD